jgi:hypothetical protein
MGDFVGKLVIFLDNLIKEINGGNIHFMRFFVGFLVINCLFGSK